MKPKPRKSQSKGFALIVTLSLMILLTVIAVGLLTLSSITLRTSSQGNAQATARANARLALMLAIGELQKSAGPDKAISATSGILSATPGKPNLTGIWESWATEPLSSSADYAKKKEDLFKGWLVSDANFAASKSFSYTTTGFTGDTIELVGKNSLGPSAVAADKVLAGKVPVTKSGNKTGAFAWYVADEGVKARINSYRDLNQNSKLWQKRALLAGHRPDVSVMKVGSEIVDFLPTDTTPQGYLEAVSTSGKIVSLNQADLFKNASRIKSFRNDVTPYSLGLLADVRNGGLKQDLSTLFELGTAMPAPYNTGKLYQTTHGITGVSDPYWSTLASYYTMYKEVLNPDTNPTINKVAPESVALTTVTPPKKFFPAPVITKAEAIFTFVLHNSHEGWTAKLKAVDPNLLYMGHLLYVPVITLHNPYNVSLQFERMKVTMKNIPVGFNFYVNGKPQLLKPTPINEMFIAPGKGDKAFVIEIGNWTSTTAGAPTGLITMKPGQTLICGPYVDAGATWPSTFDWRNGRDNVNLTGNDSAPMKAKPGFLGKAVGFGVDWLTPFDSSGYVATDGSNDGTLSVFGLRGTDQVYIESSVIQPSANSTVKDRFEVSASITAKAGGTAMPCGGLTFQYQDQVNLTKFFPKPLRFPASGTKSAIDMWHADGDALASMVRAQAFAVFSVYGRTTNGGVYETDKRVATSGALNQLRDGQLAGKPFLFHNPAKSVVAFNFSSEKPGNQSYEMNFQTLPGSTDDMYDQDALKRTIALTSNKRIPNRSIKSGSYLEIPTGPMQTIADFRRSNALTSSYLPNFVQPVGNSYVSPLMSTNSVRQGGIASYDLLDHSYLGNHALYDKYYFSTLTAINTKSASDVFVDFMKNTSPLISQAFQPYLGEGKTLEMAKSELFDASKPTADAYKRAARYQMVRGPFNVNSTSVQAWKAMLSSMNKSDMVTLWSRSGLVESTSSVETPVTAMSLLNGGLATRPSVDATKTDDVSTNQWNGYRELSAADVDKLATEIVRQVRARGPFLSMSEFVNRRVGAESELTRAGAIQQAIDVTRINDAVFGTQVPINAGDLSNTSLYGYKTPAVSEGNPAAGAPGWISQGDIMRILEPAATVRSDTFVIRACGEATDAGGKVTARAYVEAVVQRVPEYVDPVDDPTVNAYELASANPTNKLFGRRFEVVLFRWLSANEI